MSAIGSAARSVALSIAAAVLCWLGSLAGCRTPAADRPAPPPAPALRYPAAERIVAIGDLHGDVGAARGALRTAGAIDGHDRWIGGQLVVVQTGDQLDRGDDDRPTLELLDRVAAQARKQGGNVLVLNGNHELMNVTGDFRYVTQRGFEEYDEFSRGWSGQLAVESRMRGRAAAFAPGGAVARKLAARPVIAIVGTTVFVHGGVLPAHVAYGLERINREASRFMWGASTKVPAILMSESSPVWTRAYSEGTPDAATCAALERVLAAAKATRMVVGHTVQPAINAACNGRVVRIDVGLSRAFGGPTQVLQLRNDAVRVLAPAARP